MDGLQKYAIHRPISLAYEFFDAAISFAISDFNNGTDVKTRLDKVAADSQKQLDSMK